MEIRLSKSCVGKQEQQSVCRILRNGYLGMGSEVTLFESELNRFIGEEIEVACVSSGTAALHLSLVCLDIGHGDEVLVPSITYVASFQAISASGAKPVACDVSLDDGFLDLKHAESMINEHTRAIMPVHYASNSRRMKNVYDLAKKYNLRVIEDAAHSFGGIRDRSKIGSEGDIVCFSFDGIKNITCGEGGAVVSKDPRFIERVKDARLLGVIKDTEKRQKGKRSWQFDVKHQGFRYHMSDIMAAIGRVQLTRFDEFKEKRRLLLKDYLAGFQDFNQLKLLNLDYVNIVPHIFVIRVEESQRNLLKNYLAKLGIESGIHYNPNHLLQFYKTTYKIPNSEVLGCELLSLPLHPELRSEQQLKVIQSVKSFFNEQKS